MIIGLFAFLMLVTFGKLFFFGLRATWGIAKFIISIVFLPLVIIGMFAAGLVYASIIVLIIIGVIVFII